MVEIRAKGILYDMDGTLVDTIEFVECLWKEMARRYSLDSDKLIKHVHGRTALDTFREFFPAECTAPEFIAAFESEFAHKRGSVHAVPGAKRVLESVNRSRWAVVTAASRLWAELKMTQAGLPLPGLLISAGDVKVGKPHPEGYLAGAKKLGIEPKDVVVFEDAVNGVTAACRAGATVIGLLTSTTEEKLRGAGADHCIKDYMNLAITEDGDDLVIAF